MSEPKTTEGKPMYMTTTILEAYARSPEEGVAMENKTWDAHQELPEGVAPNFDEYYEKSVGAYSAFKKALKDSIEEGGIPGDVIFFCDGERCIVNMGDWHEKEDYSSAEALAKDYFKEVKMENECGSPEWSNEKIDGRSVGAKKVTEKKAMTVGQGGSRKAIPLTGPEALYHALERLDLGKLESEAREIIRSKKVSKRPRAVQILNALQGMQRNELKPTDLMISQVPVIPAQFRPYMVMGNSFTPGDANELYRDLFKIRDAFTEAHTELGEEGTGEARLQLYDAVKSLYGYREPVEPKTAARGVSGFLQKISGKSPKTSFVQRVMLSKTQDNVGRATATPDPDLGMDHVGIPHDMAWKTFAPYIQSRLVRQGLSPSQAVIAMRDRSSLAKTALDIELKVRPVIYSRAPAWHKFSTVSGWARLVDGNSIVTNPYITTGQNLDYDGDALNIHVPSMDDAVEEAKNILMPSKSLFTDRDYDKVASPLKHEQILGTFAAQHRPAKNTHSFSDSASAIDAIKRGRVSLSDEVSISGFDT